MGKKAKEHRKKVEARNRRIAEERAKFEKEYRKILELKSEELQAKFNDVVQEGIDEKQKENQIDDAVVLEEINDTETKN